MFMILPSWFMRVTLLYGVFTTTAVLAEPVLDRQEAAQLLQAQQARAVQPDLLARLP